MVWNSLLSSSFFAAVVVLLVVLLIASPGPAHGFEVGVSCSAPSRLTTRCWVSPPPTLRQHRQRSLSLAKDPLPSQPHDAKDIRIAFLEKELATLEEYKDELKEDKTNLLEDKKNLLVDKSDLKERIKNLEKELLFAKASLTAVVQLRSLVEFMLSSWAPDISASTSSKKLVRELLNTTNHLKDEWKTALVSLESDDPKLEESVCKELADVYHELSKEIHFPGALDTGFLVGGSLPLRPAAGLLLLALQKKTSSNGAIEIKYCDEKFNPRFILKNGNIGAVHV